MKLILTLAIIASALAFGSIAAEARPVHRHSQHHVRREMARVAAHHHRRVKMARLQRRRYGRHALVRLEAPLSGALRQLVARDAAENGVPYGLANAIVTIESRYNPRVSNAGALGLMQIKAQTARGLGFRGTAAGLFDPDVNLRYGMRYLALAYRQSRGNLCATVMRYQSGIGATRMSAANRAYCSRASSLMARI